MNQAKSSLPLSNLWQRNEPSSDIIEALINQIKEPAIVFDLKKNIILHANSQFLKLSLFTLKELLQMDLMNVFSDLYAKDLISGNKELNLSVVLRNKQKARISSTIFQISEKANKFLLLVNATEQQAVNIRINKIEMLDKYIELSKVYQHLEIFELIGRIANQLSHNLENDHIAIYKYHESQSRYLIISSNEKNISFPKILERDDLVLGNEILSWTKGKRVENAIQRCCLSSSTPNVIIVPFGLDTNVRGCIVIAGQNSIEDILILKTLQLYGGLIEKAYSDQSKNICIKLMQANKERIIFEQNKIIENLNVGIIIVDNDLIIQKANPSAEIMLGYSNDEIKGEDVANILIGTDNLYSALESARSNIHTPNLGNSTLHRRNGQAFPAKIQVYPISDSASLLAIAILIHDISENEEIRQRSQQLEQRAVIGELTAIFAHEVRNPINNISTGLQLLHTKLQDGDKNKELVSRMRGDCNRLTNLMDSVLAFSRPMEPKFEKLDITEFIQRLLIKWNSRLTRVKIKHHFSYEENLPCVKGDPRALEQVFTNLINNAIEVMKEMGGTLAIKLKVNCDISKYKQVEITIADNGPGIPEDIKKRIFEPFVSASSNGTGLGLAITKRIITAHRGSINVESFPGGTIFRILLPEANGDEHGTYNIDS